MENDLTKYSDIIGLIPIVVVLISAIIYFFGVRWGETQVREYNAASHYFAGILFIINCMLEPYLILFEIYMQWFIISLLLLVELCLLVLLQYGADCLKDRRKSYTNFDKYGTVNLRERFKWFIDLFRSFVRLRFIPFVMIFIMYYLCKLSNSFEVILVSFVLAFLIFTNFAYCAGYYGARYQISVLYLKDGMSVCGIILKHGSMIEVLTENGACSINRDDISIIKVENISEIMFCKYPRILKAIFPV